MKHLILSAIELNLRLREINPETEKCFEMVRFAREMKTIHINVGRKSLKSSTIALLSRPSDLIIVHDQNAKHNFIHNSPCCCSTIKCIDEVVSSADTLRGRIVKKYDYVWIDEPELCEDHKDTNILYKVLSANLFIKLGA